MNTSNFLYYFCSLFNSIPSTCKYVGIQFLNRVIVVYYKYVYIYTKCPLKLHSIYIWYNVVLHDKQDQAFLVELFIDIIKAIFFSTIYYITCTCIWYSTMHMPCSWTSKPSIIYFIIITKIFFVIIYCKYYIVFSIRILL